jgi:CDP-diacylglycerol--serine O-phosphatidyltransferase
MIAPCHPAPTKNSMSETQDLVEHAPPASPDKPKRFEMLRDFTPADLITLSNAACGTGTLFICLYYLAEGSRKTALWPAFILLPLALVFDIFDGYVARKTRRASLIGADLDSLSDVVSFGVAPAVLGFTLGLRGGWDMMILIYFVLCGISRLARFNATADDMLTDKGKVSHFEGTPIPSSLLIVLVLGILFSKDLVGLDSFLGGSYRIGWLLHPFSLIFAFSGSLMISKIRVPKP